MKYNLLSLRDHFRQINSLKKVLPLAINGSRTRKPSPCLNSGPVLCDGSLLNVMVAVTYQLYNSTIFNVFAPHHRKRRFKRDFHSSFMD